jgi:hypothetical protein
VARIGITAVSLRVPLATTGVGGVKLENFLDKISY